jgi:serine/threonine protein kinase
LQIGQTFGAYQILAKVGEGGMGEVYRARDTRLGRDVALKILAGTYTQDEDRIRRFRQEATAASALNHPGILTIHEAGDANSSEAVKWLREAVATGFLVNPLFERDALLDKIRTAPEFVQFMTELKATVDNHRREFDR